MINSENHITLKNIIFCERYPVLGVIPFSFIESFPLSGFINPLIIFVNRVFPEPLGPSIIVIPLVEISVERFLKKDLLFTL